MKYTLLLTALLLAACAPVVITPAPGGELLPEQVQRAADAWTATARAGATQFAGGLATDAAARATSTAAAQATRDALAVEQTRAALQLTAGAGAAMSTDIAAQRTQAAAQTQIWATPTWAAVATGAAREQAAARATATQLAARAAKSAASAEALQLMAQGLGLAALLAGLAIGAVLTWWVNRRQQIRTDVYQELQWQAVARAEAETERARAELVRAMLVERDGAPWLITPRGLVPMLPGGLPVQAENNRAREWRWRAALKRAVYCGIAIGQEKGSKPCFGERDLAGERGAWIVNPDGTPSSAGYRRLNRLLRQMKIWTTSGRDTAWAPGWDETRFEREFDLIPLPPLPDGEPPDVRIPDRSSAVAAISPFPAVPQ